MDDRNRQQLAPAASGAGAVMEDAPDRPHDSEDAENGQAQARPRASRGSPLKRRGVRIGLAVFGLAVLLAGLAWLLRYETAGKYIEGTDDAYLQADMVTVAPRVGGYVEQVLVQNNQDVKAGQPLVRIDARDYQAQVAQFQSQIDIARANADALRAQIGEQQSAINEARTRLAAAQANAAFALAEQRRYAPLARIGAETAEQLAAKRNQATQAGQQAAMLRAALASAEKRVTSLNAQIRQAEAQGETAAAQLAAARVSLEATLVSASVDGRIGDQTVSVGQFVQPGTRMMSVVPLGSLYVTANFKETQIGRMRVGQPAQLKVDALPGVELHGRVESVAPGTGAQFSLLPPQNATGNFTKIVQRVPVRIALDASPELRRVLVPGLSVTVDVNTISAKDDAKRMQDSAGRRNGGGL